MKMADKTIMAGIGAAAVSTVLLCCWKEHINKDKNGC